MARPPILLLLLPSALALAACDGTHNTPTGNYAGRAAELDAAAARSASDETAKLATEDIAAPIGNAAQPAPGNQAITAVDAH